MSFFNALVREFFSHDPFNSMPSVQMQPAMQPRIASSVQMTQMTQMVEGMMLNGDVHAQPKVTVHRTSRSMHNLSQDRHRASRIDLEALNATYKVGKFIYVIFFQHCFLRTMWQTVNILTQTKT